jgi:hypothetical protein
MTAWMLYLTLVSVLLGIAARLTEGALLLHGRAVRYVWLAALTGSLALPLLVRLTPVADGARGMVVELPVANEPTAAPSHVRTRPLLDRIQLPARFERAAGITWAASAALAFLGLSMFFGGLSFAARRWPRGRMDDADVRLSDGAGPAVFGLLRPVIVVPAWLMHCPAEVRQLALLHEREHVAARDPLLLALSATLLAITPWNPASWWMYARLRAAVELDCDRRVLLRGANVGAYGAMLLGIAGRSSSPILSAALVEPAVLLERRIVAMTPNHQRRRGACSVVLLTAGGIAALLACDLNSPTTPAPAAPENGAVVEKVQLSPELERKMLVEKEALAVYLARVNDNATSRMKSAGKPAAGEVGTIELRKKLLLRELDKAERAAIEEKIVAEKAAGSVIRQRLPEPEPLIVIDGRIVESSRLRELSPDRIERVDVFKGAAAIRLYGEPGRVGVVQITTHK